jgi:hypothetical protein
LHRRVGLFVKETEIEHEMIVSMECTGVQWLWNE